MPRIHIGSVDTGTVDTTTLVGNCVWNGTAWTFAGSVISTRPSFAGKLLWLGGGPSDDPTPDGSNLAAQADIWIPAEII